jgi:nucleotide-binding universal stress UspA family protein
MPVIRRIAKRGWPASTAIPMRGKRTRARRARWDGTAFVTATVMTLFRRILVPHDFSEHATRALVVAADLARRTRGRLEVLHVLTPLYGGPGYPSQEAIAWTPDRERVAQLERRLALVVAAALPARGAPPVRVRVVRGEALTCILAAARRADAIVMATLGRTGLAHVLLGSVAEKVVRHAPIPVLTVRARTRARAARRRKPARKRISTGRRARAGR